MTEKPRIAAVALNPAIDWTITIPGFTAGQVNRVAQSQVHPGGKAVNVASLLADCGFAVTVTGFLGADNDHIFRQLFTSKGITDHCVRIAGSTRTGIKVVDPASQQTTDINFPGQTPAASDLATLRTVIAELAASHNWFVFSGSVPPGVPATIYSELLHLVQGKRTTLDTSGEPLRQAVTIGATVVKPNIHELEELAGRTLDTQAAILQAGRTLLSYGSESAVVSMGKRGALFIEADQVVLATPPAVIVHSTVGAGDAMVAGIVVAKARGLPLVECARLATAFAVNAITRVDAGLPAPDVLAAYWESVQVQIVV